MGIDLRAIKDQRVRERILEALRAGCPESGPLAPVCPAQTPRPPRRLRQDSHPLLNKLESEWYDKLLFSHPGWHIRPQALRFKLGNGIWYKPDFTAVSIADKNAFAWEVKGPKSWRGGFENLKVAASLYPEWIWVLVWKQPSGTWADQRVLP